jgi:hypothetical protein
MDSANSLSLNRDIPPVIFRGLAQVNRNLLARGLALFLIGICFAAYIYHDIQEMRRLGRDQFLAAQAVDQASRFDSTATTPLPALIAIFGALFITIPLFLFYELLVFVISKGLKSAGIGIENSATAPAPNLPFS